MGYRENDLSCKSRDNYAKLQHIAGMERLILRYAYDRGALIAGGKPTGIIDQQIEIALESMRHKTRVFLST